MDPSYHSDHSQQQQPQTMTNLVGGGSLSHAQGIPQPNVQAQSGLARGTGAIPPHLMELMTNPALAAAAAASPLFPPAALLSNPSAYLSMPEAFAAGALQARQQGHDVPPTLHAGAMIPNLDMPQPGVPLGQATTQHGGIAGLCGVNSFMGLPLQTTAVSIPQPPSSVQLSQEDKKKLKRNDLSMEERQRQNRDRNREHARSTRLRKKAYVAKLKELVEGLHAERTEEVRQRRIAIQSLAEMQNVRRSVVRSFLRYHASYETDERKWNTLLEDKFWLKQPVTPYRSFRSSEIEKSYHISRGYQSLMCDAASLSVMIESIGSKSPRWMQRKREEFKLLEEAKRGARKMPSCIVRQESRLQHTISSLSSSSVSSNHGSSSEEAEKHKSRFRPNLDMLGRPNDVSNTVDVAQGDQGAAKVSSSSGSSNDSRGKHDASNDFHDYHAKPLPDPELADSDRSSTSADDSPEESNSSTNTETKRVSTDSSSGDDSAAAIDAAHIHKRRKVDSGTRLTAGEAAMVAGSSSQRFFPANIAKKGGIPHNIQPVATVANEVPVNGAARLTLAPAVPLRPFAGIGKSQKVGPSRIRDNDPDSGAANGITAEVDTTTTSSTALKFPQIRAAFYINEDDMILMDDILMCPFTFRTHDAVVCGALAECVMPGMLRAHFSERNKLVSLELVYDAMGFMQQLERASGREGAAQVIPSTLEMALTPSSSDARVITMAKPPFQIVNVNEVWTQITGYTQMEVEGEPYVALLEGEGTVPQAYERQGKPKYDLEDVARGRSACMTNIHYDKDGNDFIEYVCSYPLTNSNGEVTHLLHIAHRSSNLNPAGHLLTYETVPGILHFECHFGFLYLAALVYTANNIRAKLYVAYVTARSTG